MSTELDAQQRQRAIDQHSLQAGEFAERYSAPAVDDFASCFRYSRRRLDDCLERWLPQRGDGLRLLDVGCGTGHHMARLIERGFTVAGVDGSDEMLQHARAINPGAELHLSDVESLPFPDSSFDYILCVEVLRYLPSSRRCLQEMARVLKPGGTCLATAAPLFSLNGYWAINRAANLVRLGNLVRLKQFFTTSRRLRRSAAQAGFSTSEVHGVYAGPINWVERLAPRALTPALKAWEPLDRAVADRWLLRDLSNMYLLVARRGS